MMALRARLSLNFFRARRRFAHSFSFGNVGSKTGAPALGKWSVGFRLDTRRKSV